MSDQSEWVSLGEAAKLLGVHPTTVRNWADQGDLPFRRTPGRHRRFKRSVLEEWAAQNKTHEKTPSAAGHNMQVIVEYALGHTRFGVEEDDLHQKEWYERLSPQAVQKSRQIGRRLLDALLHHLEERYPEGDEFTAARAIGREYAELLQSEKLTLVQAVEGFVYFDDFLVESVIRMLAPNLSTSPSEWSDLLRQINAFTNEVLISMIRHYLSVT